jgi:hypothetical protein
VVCILRLPFAYFPFADGGVRASKGRVDSVGWESKLVAPQGAPLTEAIFRLENRMDELLETEWKLRGNGEDDDFDDDDGDDDFGDDDDDEFDDDDFEFDDEDEGGYDEDDDDDFDDDDFDEDDED